MKDPQYLANEAQTICWYDGGVGAGEIAAHLFPAATASKYRPFLAEFMASFADGNSLDTAFWKASEELARWKQIDPDDEAVQPYEPIPRALFDRIRSGLVALLHLWLSQRPRLLRREALSAMIETELQELMQVKDA